MERIDLLLLNVFCISAHSVFEAIIFVDVSSASAQLDAVTQTDSPPLGLSELRHRNAVHLPSLTVFIHHCLLTEAKTPIVLKTESRQTFSRMTSQIRQQTVAASTHPGALDLLINFIEFQSVTHVSHSSLDSVTFKSCDSRGKIINIHYTVFI